MLPAADEKIQIIVTDFQTASQTAKADVVNLEGAKGKKSSTWQEATARRTWKEPTA